MPQTALTSRVGLCAFALIIPGVFFLLYPALRPFFDETSLEGAKAFASNRWLSAHMPAMVAFTLLPVGLLGLHHTLQHITAQRLAYWALVLGMIGTGLTLLFYGGEAYGLHGIGQDVDRGRQVAARPVKVTRPVKVNSSIE
jgi:hypothetical protein